MKRAFATLLMYMPLVFAVALVSDWHGSGEMVSTWAFIAIFGALWYLISE